MLCFILFVWVQSSCEERRANENGKMKTFFIIEKFKPATLRLQSGHIERLHLETRVHKGSCSIYCTYLSEQSFILNAQSFPSFSKSRHAHCCVSRCQSNSRSCASTTRVGIKIQMTQL